MNKEEVKEIRDKVVKIITDSKATFFVSSLNKNPLPKLSEYAQEVLYELRAEICTNVEMYFYKLLEEN